MIVADYTKEQDAIASFGLDWSKWLGTRTVVSSSWSAPSGITIEADAFTGSTTTIQVSGGTWTNKYELLNHVVLSNGDEEENSILIKIQFDARYCTGDEVRRRATQATITALTADELDALIEQASRFFDRLCGVQDGYFNGPLYPIPTTKTFYGNGTNYLPVEPYVTGSLDTSLTLPSGVTQPDFVERNGYLVMTTSTGYGPPFTGFYSSCWPGWAQGMPITISAIWGFQDSDAAVKLAVIELIINLWRETDPAQVKLVNIEGQPLRERVPPRVELIAKKYKNRRMRFI